MRRFLLRILSNYKIAAMAVPLLLLPGIAEAWNPFNPFASMAAAIQEIVVGVIFIINYILSFIAGLMIAIQSWFLEIILHISMGLVNSTPVKIGFPIVLSIANLFFVGALIAIAIATILRREEYGMKKVLWKLVVMSIMVNFGLVICGSLLSISDETTKFFIQSVSPGTVGDQKQSFNNFANSIAGAFNPPGFILSQADLNKDPGAAKGALSFFSVGGDEISKVIKPIVGLMFTVGSLVIIIITLATLNLMLLWRYIRLSMAMILLPLAWASWIFPTYQEHYKKWWTKFTQLALFPPVVVFFLWLALKTSEVMRSRGGEYANIWSSQSGNPISDFLGALIAPIISQALQSFVLFGIMMGGMVAAQELGVKFADGGYKAIEGAGKGAKNWAMNRANRATVRPQAAAKRAAIRGGANIAAVGEKMRLPWMNKKTVIDDQGRASKVEMKDEEKLSGRMRARAESDDIRDEMEEKAGAGRSFKQRRGETTDEWQERLAKKDDKFKPKVGKPESDEAWSERFADEAGTLAYNNPSLKQGSGESYEDWKARIIAAHPSLDRKPGEKESRDEWKKRVGEMIEELTKKDKGNVNLFASIWNGATDGFQKGTGHKPMSTKEAIKALQKMGAHIHDDDHDAPHPPSPDGKKGDGDSHGH